MSSEEIKARQRAIEFNLANAPDVLPGILARLAGLEAEIEALRLQMAPVEPSKPLKAPITPIVRETWAWDALEPYLLASNDGCEEAIRSLLMYLMRLCHREGRQFGILLAEARQRWSMESGGERSA